MSQYYDVAYKHRASNQYFILLAALPKTLRNDIMSNRSSHGVCPSLARGEEYIKYMRSTRVMCQGPDGWRI